MREQHAAYEVTGGQEAPARTHFMCQEPWTEEEEILYRFHIGFQTNEAFLRMGSRNLHLDKHLG